MDTAQRQTELGLLDEWVSSKPRSSLWMSHTTVDQPGLRFAFYGRTSTIGHQDRTSSQGWQREAADSVIAGHGAVVLEFFDAGVRGGCRGHLVPRPRRCSRNCRRASAGSTPW